MSEPIPISVAVEDELSEAIALRLLEESPGNFQVGRPYRRSGFGYLKKNMPGFNKAARGTPFFVLTDLDRRPCPSALIADWLSQPKHPNLILRVAVREVESWLLADDDGLSKFLGISKTLVPRAPDTLDDPKKSLILLAARSKFSNLRAAIVPPPKSIRVQGPDYNGPLAKFAQEKWNLRAARQRSPSLDRALLAIERFKPTF